jgi:hypothetical protein
MFHLDIRTKFDIGQHSDSRFHPQAMNQAVPSFAVEIRGLAKNFEQPAVDGFDLTKVRSWLAAGGRRIRTIGPAKAAIAALAA